MSDNLQKGLNHLIKVGTGELAPSFGGVAACHVEGADFAEAAGIFKDADFRLVAEWASDEGFCNGAFAVYAAYNKDTDYRVVKACLPSGELHFPTLTGEFPAAYRFERRIMSLMGLVPEGHPDPRPWIKHEDWPGDAYPLRKSFDGAGPLVRVEGDYRWVRAEGEGVYEIPVGPVHAGIIEPGHFRFQAVGEEIINLETRFGYVHKGIEKRFEALSWDEAVRLAGRVSGDSTVAHATAFCMAAEEASGCVPPERARYLRAIMMERERIANHLGDIGAVCNDTAFAFLLYQFSTLREKMLRTNSTLFGHRLMMDRVTLCGVKVDLDGEGKKAIFEEMACISAEFERLVRIYEDNPSLEDRVHGAGILSPDDARALGVVGFVARSSGQRLDARLQNPFRPYDVFIPDITLLSSGDVHARVWVRIEEVRDSLRLIREMLKDLPEGPVVADWTAPLEGRSGFSAVEGWRGELVYWIQCGPDGGINRCMVRDPSSVNWSAIERAIRGNIVPDFPLCNKSFNQSYSGHDL